LTWLRKERGESGIGPHWWPADGSVIEVPDHLAADLLAIDPGEYSKAEAPKPEPKAAAKTAEPAKAEDAPKPAAPAAKA
jgi:hypothetical protein